nr:hypothetical protein CFP56_35421 [Quercus suber]
MASFRCLLNLSSTFLVPETSAKSVGSPIMSATVVGLFMALLAVLRNVCLSSNEGASATTLVQLRLQHSATDSALGQHQHVSGQAKHSDDVTACARATNMKIEELNDCLVTESSIA